MPLKLNIAMSRKVGQPNYGSRGATVGLEMEVDSSLANEPQQLHERITRMFQLAKQSIDAELGSRSANGQHASPADSTSGTRMATANQIRAIHAIANRENVDVVEKMRGRFHIERLEDLSLEQASQLIDAIQPSTNGVKVP
jgi:hypothetical protein